MPLGKKLIEIPVWMISLSLAISASKILETVLRHARDREKKRAFYWLSCWLNWTCGTAKNINFSKFGLAFSDADASLFLLLLYNLLCYNTLENKKSYFFSAVIVVLLYVLLWEEKKVSTHLYRSVSTTFSTQNLADSLPCFRMFVCAQYAERIKWKLISVKS